MDNVISHVLFKQHKFNNFIVLDVNNNKIKYYSIRKTYNFNPPMIVNQRITLEPKYFFVSYVKQMNNGLIYSCKWKLAVLKIFSSKNIVDIRESNQQINNQNDNKTTKLIFEERFCCKLNHIDFTNNGNFVILFLWKNNKNFNKVVLIYSLFPKKLIYENKDAFFACIDNENNHCLIIEEKYYHILKLDSNNSIDFIDTFRYSTENNNKETIKRIIDASYSHTKNLVALLIVKQINNVNFNRYIKFIRNGLVIKKIIIDDAMSIKFISNENLLIVFGRFNIVIICLISWEIISYKKQIFDDLEKEKYSIESICINN